MTKNPQIILKGRFQVVPRTLILIFNGNKILLQKGSAEKKIWAGYYNGLGGHIEKNEDVISAAKRELFEEAGINCPDLHLAGTVVIDVEENNGILLFVFHGENTTGNLVNSEEGSLHWIDLDKIGQIHVVEDIPEIVTLIQKNKESRTIFHAHYAYDIDGKRITSYGNSSAS